MWSRLALVLLALIAGSKPVASAAYPFAGNRASSDAIVAISGRIHGPQAGMRSGVLLAVGDQIGPSFDCGTVTAPLPRLICTNPRLSYVDLLMVQAYQALRAQLDEPGKAKVRSQAADLHETVLSECDIPDDGPLTPEIQQEADCVENYYTRQRNEWLSRMRPDAHDEAVRAIRRHIELQRVLQQLSFLSSLTTVDGVYGPETRKAIADWQASRGLSATGVLSDQHASLLEQTLAEQAAARVAEQQRQEAMERERERAEQGRRDSLERERLRAEQQRREELERQRAEQQRQETAERDRQRAEQERLRAEQQHREELERQRTEQQRQETAERDRQRAEQERQEALDRERQRAEQQRWERERAEALQRERNLFQTNWDGCKAYQAAACDAALVFPDVTEAQRGRLIEWRSEGLRFASDAQSCKGGVAAACEMALKSPAASPRDQVYLSQWAEANSLWSRAWKYTTSAAGAVFNAIAGTPLSTLIVSVIALALAIALMIVLVRSHAATRSPVEMPQSRPLHEAEPVEQTFASQKEEPRVSDPPASEPAFGSEVYERRQPGAAEKSTNLAGRGPSHTFAVCGSR